MHRMGSRQVVLPFLLALAALFIVFVPTLQTIPNGSGHYYMIDVGETQIVLNAWGTLHMTGYPLYVISGNMLTAMLRAPGVTPVVAPTLVAFLWGALALVLFYTLAVHLTGRPWESAAVVVLFGLLRTVWIHHVIAEIYTFGLVLLILLLLLALWKRPVDRRVVWLALLGGIGVGHHRAIAMVAPALIYAVWHDLFAGKRVAIVRRLSGALILGALGVFVPYLYLLLRGRAGAAWVYGQPETWRGLVEQFTGAEVSRFIGLPGTLAALESNVRLVNRVLVTDLTLPGLLLGVAGLMLALRAARLRRAAVALLLNGAAAYVFHALFYTDVLSALILPVLLSVAFGWLLLIDRLSDAAGGWTGVRRRARWMWLPLAILLAGVLLRQNRPFIREQVTNADGLDAIALAEAVPSGATLMIDWGTRHFAVGFARDIDPSWAKSDFSRFTLVDHNADLAQLAADGSLVTPAYTFYNRPLAWWEARVQQPVYLEAVAPFLVRIGTAPGQVDDPPEVFGPVGAAVVCEAGRVLLDVTWYTPDHPAADLSVFVHALDASGALLGQGDQSAPVYGWRPLTGWQAGEAVRDVYVVEANPVAVALLRYGFYRATDSGFANLYEYEQPVNCRS